MGMFLSEDSNLSSVVSNNYGKAYKYSDGTMITCVSKTVDNISTTYPRNSLYVSDSISAMPYPAEFVETPIYTRSIGWSGKANTSGAFDYSSFNQESKSQTGTFQVARPESTNDVSIKITVIAIGRWK